MSERLEREAMLLGSEGVEKLKKSRVALFGVGGVGSYAAEALVRAGVGAIDIIDNDTVSVSNLNRQLCALTSTVGRVKVDVVAERLLDIAPELKIRKYADFVLPENIDKLVSAGDVIAVRENFRGSAKCKSLAEALQTKNAPKWLDVDKTNLTAKVVALPARDDVDFEINEQHIVEFYSK